MRDGNCCIVRLAHAGKAKLEVCADWQVAVSIYEKNILPNLQADSVCLDVIPPPVIAVTDEKCASLPLFNFEQNGWLKGYRLAGLRTQETSAKGLLFPDSLQLRAVLGTDSVILQRGKDYEVDPDWATLGRLANGVPQDGQPVFVDYNYAKSRIDSIVVTTEGLITIKQGKPQVAVSHPPKLMPGEKLLANLWVSGRLTKLTVDNLYPVLETCYPEPPKQEPVTAAKLIPKTYSKLCAGRSVRVLAWGDSVTSGDFLANPLAERWQEQFIARLRNKFPRTKITLITEAWGGHNSGSYLAELPGAEHNLREKVLDIKPDLIISEFVNDSELSPEQVDVQYGRILAEFRSISAEWIILTPHYVLPEWMGFKSQEEVYEDMRGYVKGVRAFATKNTLALADTSRRWARLWRQGIPYMTLMLNAVNHPDARGMRFFADSLMELF